LITITEKKKKHTVHIKPLRPSHVFVSLFLEYILGTFNLV
jgi:hypothetical protein